MTSVDGLVSGLNTTDIISQLMRVEAAGQDRLKSQVSAKQQVQSAYQSINSRMLAVRSAAEAMTSAGTWQAVKATGSSDAVTVTAGSGASAGSTTFSVTRLAKAHVITFQEPASGPATASGTLDVTVGGATVHVTVAAGNNTAQGLADAINAADPRVRAVVVGTAAGQRLQISAV